MHHTNNNDTGVGAPYLRSIAASGREERTYPAHELRVAGEGDKRIATGYAAVFNVLSVPLWGFRELIEPGTFKKTIQEADIRGLWNHDTNLVLGRTKNGTLRLWEDEVGLAFEIDLPDTQAGRDAAVSIERGDVDQVSFGFEVVRDIWGTQDGETLRRLQEVKLFDISPVTFPAYPQTEVTLRALLGSDIDDVNRALRRLAEGGLTAADRRLLGTLIDRVERRLAAPGQEPHPADTAVIDGGSRSELQGDGSQPDVPAAPTEDGHPADPGSSESVRARLLNLRRVLDLAEHS